MLCVFSRCKECCLIMEACSCTVSPEEAAILELKELTDNEVITTTWLEAALTVSKDKVAALTKTQVDAEKQAVKAQVR